MGCPDNSFKYLSSEANARGTLVKVGAIDNQDKIIDRNKFKEQAKRFLDYVKKDFNLDVVSVISAKNLVAQFNKDVFSKIDKIRGYDKINKQTINNALNPVKEVIKPKEGVDFVFEQFPELAKIGSKEQYAKYISTIFPESKVKDIVYHGTYQDFEGFDKEKLGETTGKGKWIDKKRNQEVDVDSSFAFFFTNNKLNASAYSYKGRANKIAEVLYHLQIVGQSSLGKTKEEVTESVNYLKATPFYNNIIETAKKEGKSNKEIQELIRKEYVELYKKTRDDSFDRFTNWQVNNYEDRKQIEVFENNINKFLNNDWTIPNRFGTFETYNAGIGNHFNIWFDRDKKQYSFYNGLNGDRFTSKEATKERLIKFFEEAKKDLNKSEQERLSKMKSLGYVEKIKPAVINLKNPLIHDYEKSAFPDTYKRQLREESGKKEVETGYIAARQVAKALKEGNDGVIYENIIDPLESNSYGVFDTNNIYTLGSKQDIEGFKKFMKNPIKSSVKNNILSKTIEINNLADELGLDKNCN